MAEAQAPSDHQGIGASVRRREDLRFITGSGRYTDDISLPGQRYAVFCRSPYPRAGIASLNSAEALAVPGVDAVLTGADMVADGLGDLPCGWMVKSKDGSDMQAAPHPPMAAETVNYVGEPYAIVIADSVDAARQGAESVEVEWDELHAVVDPGQATVSEAIYAGIDNNLAYQWALGDEDATRMAFAKAAHVTRS